MGQWTGFPTGAFQEVVLKVNGVTTRIYDAYPDILTTSFKVYGKGCGTGNTVFDYSWKFELPNNGFLGGGGSSFTVSGSNEHTTDPINLVELVTTPTTDWVCLHLVLKATFYDINEEKVVTQTLRDAKYYWHKTNVNPPADSGTGQ